LIQIKIKIKIAGLSCAARYKIWADFKDSHSLRGETHIDKILEGQSLHWLMQSSCA